LSSEQASEAYYNSDIFLLPTVLESFCLTYLEAMQHDCPVITSDMDFAHYICEDAAIYFDPFSSQSILQSIIKLSKNDELRTGLIKKGKHRLTNFFNSWDSVAEEFVKAIEEGKK